MRSFRRASSFRQFPRQCPFQSFRFPNVADFFIVQEKQFEPGSRSNVYGDQSDVSVMEEQKFAKGGPKVLLDVKYARPFRFVHNPRQFWRVTFFEDVNTFVEVQCGTLSKLNEYARDGQVFPVSEVKKISFHESWLSSLYIMLVRSFPSAFFIAYFLTVVAATAMWLFGWGSGIARNTGLLIVSYIICIVLFSLPFLSLGGFIVRAFLRRVNTPRLRFIEGYEEELQESTASPEPFYRKHRKTV
jgi:hypothetical protein